MRFPQTTSVPLKDGPHASPTPVSVPEAVCGGFPFTLAVTAYLVSAWVQASHKTTATWYRPLGALPAGQVMFSARLWSRLQAALESRSSSPPDADVRFP